MACLKGLLLRIFTRIESAYNVYTEYTSIMGHEAKNLQSILLSRMIPYLKCNYCLKLSPNVFVFNFGIGDAEQLRRTLT